MKLNEIVDAFRRAKPAELEEAAPVLREALAIMNAPVPPPVETAAGESRAIQTPLERCRSRAEDEAEREIDAQQRAALVHNETEANRKAAEANRKAEEARLAVHDHDVQRVFGDRHAARVARFWEGREPLVDELIDRCLSEATLLWKPSTATFPTSVRERERRLDSMHSSLYGRPVVNAYSDTVSDEAYIARRQRGLRDLADTVRRWARAGAYDDAADLQARFDVEYAKLATVPSIRELVQQARQAGPPSAA